MLLEPLLTARQLAEALAMPEATVQAWRRRREVPALRVGGAVRYRLAEVEAWLARDDAAPAHHEASSVDEGPAEAAEQTPRRPHEDRVRQLREAGAPWREVGRELGVTRQAAHQQYAYVEDDVPAARRREVRPRPVVTDPDESRRPVLDRCAECGLRVPPRLPCIPCATRAGHGAQARAAHEAHFARAS